MAKSPNGKIVKSLYLKIAYVWTRPKANNFAKEGIFTFPKQLKCFMDLKLKEMRYRLALIKMSLFKNGPVSASFCLFSVFFSQTLQFLQLNNLKKSHRVYGASIRTHNLLNTSLLPLPLDQGSRHTNCVFE